MKFASAALCKLAAAFLLLGRPVYARSGFMKQQSAIPRPLRDTSLKCDRPEQAAPLPKFSGAWPLDSPCNSGLFADREDGSIRSYNLVLSPEHLAQLDSNVTAEKYVPCDLVVDYGTSVAATVHGVKCRYKGSVGSFVGCSDPATGAKLPSNKVCRKPSWKINLKHAKNKSAVSGSKTIQLLGMQHDDSLLKNRLSYAILNDAGFVAPCAAPANVYVNGIYSGLSDMIENIDSVFTRKRSILASDRNGGAGTLYKETWPLSPDPDYYRDFKPIPGLARPSIQETGDGIDHSNLFADLRRQAEDCVKQGDECTAESAGKILDFYVDAESFINGLVGMTMVANWDQIVNLIHNFYIYIKNDKLFYIPWDFNEVLASVHGAPLSSVDNPTGISLPYPWYHILTAEEKMTACPYGGAGALAHFTCDPVAELMAKAWQQRFFETFRRVSELAAPKAEAHVARWKAQTSSAISCDAENGNWPPVAVQEAAAEPLLPMFRRILDFWNGLSDGTAQWPVLCFSILGCFERPKFVPKWLWWMLHRSTTEL